MTDPSSVVFSALDTTHLGVTFVQNDELVTDVYDQSGNYVERALMDSAGTLTETIQYSPGSYYSFDTQYDSSGNVTSSAFSAPNYNGFNGWDVWQERDDYVWGGGGINIVYNNGSVVNTFAINSTGYNDSSYGYWGANFDEGAGDVGLLDSFAGDLGSTIDDIGGWLGIENGFSSITDGLTSVFDSFGQVAGNGASMGDFLNQLQNWENSPNQSKALVLNVAGAALGAEAALLAYYSTVPGPQQPFVAAAGAVSGILSAAAFGGAAIYSYMDSASGTSVGLRPSQ